MQPPDQPSPNVAVRRLSRTLRNLRTEAGLGQDQVRDALDISQGKLSRLENGEFQRVNLNDLRALLAFYGVSDDQRDALLDLARASRQPGWWETYDSVLGSAYAGFEQEAEAISTFQPLVIPGLLQTAAYTEAAIRGDQITDPQEITSRLAFRTARQEKVLTRSTPPRLTAIIDQAALARPFGSPDDRKEQLQRLVTAAESPRITVQVIPFEAGMHAGLACGFTILDYAEDPSITYVEMGGNALYLEKPHEVQDHKRRFQHLQDIALDSAATARLLSRLMNDLK